MALEQNRQSRSLERMEGVARLVQEGPNIVIDAHRVHEDQRLLSERQGLAVSARGLAFAIVQIEQLGVHHRLVVLAELGVDLAEHAGSAANERLHVLEGLEGSSAKR